MAQFWEIHSKSKPWMQASMEIALATLQGRVEIINMKFSDYQDNVLKMVWQKSGKHQHSHRMIHCPRIEKIVTLASQPKITTTARQRPKVGTTGPSSPRTFSPPCSVKPGARAKASRAYPGNSIPPSTRSGLWAQDATRNRDSITMRTSSLSWRRLIAR